MELPMVLAEDIVKACLKLYQRNLVANHDGNITVKWNHEGVLYFVATPTSFSKGDVTAADLLILDSSGKVVSGKHKVFSEMALHMAIYRVRPDIQCIVHGHPPAASAFGLAQKPIGTPALPEAIVSLGREIGMTPFISPLDPEIKNVGGKIDQYFIHVLEESDAFLIPGNGAWTVGADVMQTYYRLELVEHIALQHYRAETLGGVNPLPEDLVEELLLRKPGARKKSISREILKDIVLHEVESLFGQGR